MSTTFDGDCDLDKFGYVPTPYWIFIISLVTAALIRNFLVTLHNHFWYRKLSFKIYALITPKEERDAERKKRIAELKRVAASFGEPMCKYSPVSTSTSDPVKHSQAELENHIFTEMATLDYELRSRTLPEGVNFWEADFSHQPSTAWYLHNSKMCESILDEEVRIRNTEDLDPALFRQMAFYKKVARTIVVLNLQRNVEDKGTVKNQLMRVIDFTHWTFSSTQHDKMMEEVLQEFVEVVEHRKKQKALTTCNLEEVPQPKDVKIDLENATEASPAKTETEITEEERKQAERTEYLTHEYATILEVDWLRHCSIVRGKVATDVDEIKELIRLNTPRWRFILGNSPYLNRIPKVELPEDTSSDEFTMMSLASVVKTPAPDGSLPSEADELNWELYFGALHPAVFYRNLSDVTTSVKTTRFHVYLAFNAVLSFISIVWTTASRRHLNGWDTFQLFCMLCMSSSIVRNLVLYGVAAVWNDRMSFENDTETARIVKWTVIISIGLLILPAFLLFLVPMYFLYLWVALLFAAALFIVGLWIHCVWRDCNERSESRRNVLFRYFIFPFMFMLIVEAATHYGVLFYDGGHYTKLIGEELRCRSTSSWIDSFKEYDDLYLRNILSFF